MGTPTASANYSPWMEIGDSREKFNRENFLFQHRLHESPLFELPRLLELARTLSVFPNHVHTEDGITAEGDRLDDAGRNTFSVEETVERLHRGSAWIVLKKAEKDPEYKALLDECMREIMEIVDPELQRQISLQEVFIFITSPNRITPYHIDTECNFLMQVRGTKIVKVFDQKDRTVVTEEDLERYFRGDHSGAHYREENLPKATVYELPPGKGVHIPVVAPHIVQNTGNISVTISVNFEFTSTARTAQLYRANAQLRRLGLNPLPPGRSALRDGVKLAALGGMMNAIDTARRLRSRR